jgi:hypothetical protein
MLNDLPLDIDLRIEEVSLYLRKIDNFWGNIEVDISPEYHDKDIDRDAIVSMRTVLLEHIMSLYLNSTTACKN